MEINGNMIITKLDNKVEFILPFGYCMKVDPMVKGITITGTNRTTLLLVDPFMNNGIRVTEMDNSKHEFGPTGEDTFDAYQYLMKLSVHDKSIDDNTNHHGEFEFCTLINQSKQVGKIFVCLLKVSILDTSGFAPSL